MDILNLLVLLESFVWAGLYRFCFLLVCIPLVYSFLFNENCIFSPIKKTIQVNSLLLFVSSYAISVIRSLGFIELFPDISSFLVIPIAWKSLNLLNLLPQTVK